MLRCKTITWPTTDALLPLRKAQISDFQMSPHWYDSLSDQTASQLMSTFLLQLEWAQRLTTQARKSFLQPDYLLAIPQHSLPGQPSI